jgi:hypothetical protein
VILWQNIFNASNIFLYFTQLNERLPNSSYLKQNRCCILMGNLFLMITNLCGNWNFMCRRINIFVPVCVDGYWVRDLIFFTMKLCTTLWFCKFSFCRICDIVNFIKKIICACFKKSYSHETKTSTVNRGGFAQGEVIYP